VGLARAAGAPDRIEAEGLDLQQRVAAGFAVVARRFPRRVRLIDGFRDIDLVAADIEAAALAAVAHVEAAALAALAAAGPRLGG
jgi:dTMP kinase